MPKSIGIVTEAYSGKGKKSGKAFTMLKLIAQNDAGKVGEVAAFANTPEDEERFMKFVNGDAVECTVTIGGNAFKPELSVVVGQRLGKGQLVVAK